MVVAKAEAWIPIVVVSLFWFGVGTVIPWFIKGPNRRFIQLLFCVVNLQNLLFCLDFFVYEVCTVKIV